MGEAAREREATDAELDAMRALLREGLAAGGFGFSSSIAESHNDADGEPVPSRHASHRELIELAAVCAEFDGTSLELVPLASAGPFPDDTRRLMIEMSRRAQRTLDWNIVHAHAKSAEEVEGKLSLSDDAAAAGAKVVALLMPIPLGLRLNLASGFVLDMLPGWDKLMALPAPEKLAMFSDPAGRAHMRELAATSRSPFARWDRYLVYETSAPSTKRFEGKRIADIARAEDQDPFDALLDIVVADELQTSFGFDAAEPTADDREYLREKLRDPRVVIGASDAGAHLDMVDSFSYTTYLQEYAVREHGLLTTEAAVHLTTQAPAELVGLRDRGVLREGCRADVVVFDEATIGRGPLHTRGDLPTGAHRLFAESTGIDLVLVNGQPVVEQGQVTDARPGAVLRAGRDTTTSSRA
jgi:N-acyl-D-aspartate/D-glutamate deacylase